MYMSYYYWYIFIRLIVLNTYLYLFTLRNSRHYQKLTKVVPLKKNEET